MDHMRTRLKNAEFELAGLRNQLGDLEGTLKRLRIDLDLANRRQSEPSLEPISPPPLPETPSKQSSSLPSPTPVDPADEFPKSTEPLQPPPTQPYHRLPAKKQTQGIELQVGRVWFVRLGIVLLLTGLVFLSNYAYQTYIVNFSPALRLGTLTFFSILLTGAGLWFEQTRQSLKTYGRVVTSGGLAALYYLAYASHHVAPLQVTDSALVGTLTMTAVALLYLGIAFWKNSDRMNALALGLAFYSTAINPTDWVSSTSTTLLAATGIAIAWQKTWTKSAFVALIGSFLASFGIEQVIHNPSLLLHTSLPYLWLLFTTYSLTKPTSLKGQLHPIFTTLNNILFFGIASFNVNNFTWIDGHWWFSLSFGGILLGLYIFAPKSYPEDSRLSTLAQSISLITLGIILKLSGHQLFLMLMLEACALSFISLRHRREIMQVFAWTIAIGSLLPILLQANQKISHEATVWLIYGPLWLTFSILQRQTLSLEDRNRPTLLPFGPAIIGTLFLAIGGLQNLDDSLHAALLVVVGILCDALAHRNPARKHALEILLAAQSLTWIAGLIFLFTNPSTILLFTISLMAFAGTWLSLKPSKLFSEPERHFIVPRQWAYPALALITLAFGIENSVTNTTIATFLFALIPLSGTLIARRTGHSAHEFLPSAFYLPLFFLINPNGFAHFLPVALGVTHLILLAYSPKSARESLLPIVLMITAILWGEALYHQVDRWWLPFAWTGLGLAFLPSLIHRNLRLLLSLTFAAIGYLATLTSENHTLLAYFAPLPALLIHLIASKTTHPLLPLRKLSILGVFSLLAIWGILTDHVSSSGLVMSWALLGSFTLASGLYFQSRAIRFTSFGILAAALAHVMMIEIWQLAPLPRILGFLTLGLGLLGLSYLYNRFHQQLKQSL